MDSGFDRNMIGPVAFLIALPIFLILGRFGMQKQWLFAIATTGPLIYTIYIELKEKPSNFIKFCIFIIFVFHIEISIFIIQNSEMKFLDRSYTATGLALLYFSILYFIVWICKRVENLFRR